MIELRNTGDAHKFASDADAHKPLIIHANLTWRSAAVTQKRPGFFGRLLGLGPSQPEDQDLDLGCLWKDKLGNKGVVQALGEDFGSQSNHPFIYLDGDDRTGQKAGGENLYIGDATVLQRAVIFAYIYKGTAFSAVAAKLTLKRDGGETIEIDLDSPSAQANFCAAALIEVNGREVTVLKENRYFEGQHRTCDAHYGWGIPWREAQK